MPASIASISLNLLLKNTLASLCSYSSLTRAASFADDTYYGL